MLRKHRALQATERVADLCDSALHDLAAHVDAGHHLVRRAGGDTSPTERYLGESLRVCCEALKKDVTRILDVPLANLGPVRDAMAACTLTLGNNPILVQLSPQRRYPSILVGPRGLGTALRGLWERTERAALLSGTLLVNTGSMGDSSGYMASLLHVPGDRIADAPPIIAPWLYSTPTAHIPGAALAARLIPPRQSASGPDTEDTNGDGDAYYAALAGVIRSASQSAAGGTLVLCTSFQAIRRLEAALATITDRLIVQTPRTPLVRCEAQFRGMAAAGQRPVWLATGGAWTGLDLRDPRVPATEDHLLTDVVITRLPINPATSLHGSLRQRRTGLAMMRLDVALRFRQGMGRLVRAEGQPDRRLWICDGRMWSSVAPHPHLTGPSKRALMVYPARAEF